MTDIGSLRLLVVEDHRVEDGCIARLLETMGVRTVYSVGDGVAALRVLEHSRTPIDIVIADLDMPGIPAVAMVRRIAANSRKPSLIFASDSPPSQTRGVANMAREYGVDWLGAVQKPVTVSWLRDAIASRAPREASGLLAWLRKDEG